MDFRKQIRLGKRKCIDILYYTILYCNVLVTKVTYLFKKMRKLYYLV